MLNYPVKFYVDASAAVVKQVAKTDELLKVEFRLVYGLEKHLSKVSAGSTGAQMK
jgi:hypothetical protein